MKNSTIYDWTRSFILAIVIVTIVFLAFSWVNNQNQLAQTQMAQIVRLTESSIGVMGKTANKEAYDALYVEMKKNNNELLSKIEEQRKATKETIDEIGVVKAEIVQTRKLYQGSTKVYDKPGMEEHHYFYKEVTVKNTEGKDVRVAWVMFYPNQPAEKQWKFGTFPIKAQTTVIESENKNGTFNRYAEIDVRNKDDEKIPVKIDSIQWEKKPISEKSFSLWNPRLGMATLVSTDDVMAGLNLSISSYGRTNRDIDWRFFTFGLDANDEDIALSIEPFSWNLGNALPIVENLFIGPALTLNTKYDTNYSVQVSIPF